MRCPTQIKTISYLKANAAEVLQALTDQRQPLVITQNGEACAVLQDVASYEQTQETLALLKILALGKQRDLEDIVICIAKHDPPRNPTPANIVPDGSRSLPVRLSRKMTP
jgi:prevent-host-death family protein